MQSVDDARRAVRATRYPPEGVRGVSVSQRSNRFGTVADYFRDINAQIGVLVQIESRAGLDAAADIAAVDGVDGIFVGPSDLAAALGHLGDPNHASVQAAIGEAFAAARSAGKPSGILATGRGRRAPLHGDGRDLRRGRQRPRRVQECDAAAPRSLRANRLSQPSISSISFDLSNTFAAPSCWHLTRISGVA